MDINEFWSAGKTYVCCAEDSNNITNGDFCILTVKDFATVTSIAFVAALVTTAMIFYSCTRTLYNCALLLRT